MNGAAAADGGAVAAAAVAAAVVSSACHHRLQQGQQNQHLPEGSACTSLMLQACRQPSKEPTWLSVPGAASVVRLTGAVARLTGAAYTVMRAVGPLTGAVVQTADAQVLWLRMGLLLRLLALARAVYKRPGKLPGCLRQPEKPISC